MTLLPFFGCRHNRPAGFSRIVLAGGTLALLSACLLSAPVVFSQVLQGPHILDLMVEMLSGDRSLRVHQAVWVVEGDGEAHETHYAETLNYLFPGRFRSDARHERTERILVSDHSRSVTVVDGTIDSERENQFDAYKDLLMHQSRNSIARNLIKWGVSLGVTSLGLWDENVVYVIGAEYPDESTSQVWVDKERFLPLRWIIRQANPAEDGSYQQIEFIYREWRPQGETWYPMRVDTHLNGRLIRQSRVGQIEVNAAVPADLFDLDRLIAISNPARSPLPEARKDETRHSVDDFKIKSQP